MPDFDFFGVPPISFGRGRVARLGELAGQLGSTALLVYNGGEAPGGAFHCATASLSAAGVKVVHVRQHGEPTVDDVGAALATAREAGADVVIGLGGGSAIDAAKAVAGLLTNGGAVTDYMEVVGRGQKITRAAAPWIAVPTTAGTGAEVTRNAVIGYPEKQFKASLRSEHLLPRAVLIDPELGLNVPPDVTARSGLDALCQLIESYTSKGAQPMTDALALQGIPLVGKWLRRAWRDGADLDARENMALAALYSGITLTNAGLGAVHGFAAPLGANFPAPHGTICGVLLPHVMAANAEAARTPRVAEDAAGQVLLRYTIVAMLLTGRTDSSQEDATRAGVEFVAELVRDLNIPRLGSFGLTEERIPEMVELAKRSSSMRFNPLVLSDETLARVLRAAI